VRTRTNGSVIGTTTTYTISSATGIWSIVDEELGQSVNQWPLASPPFFEYLTATAASGSTIAYGLTGTIVSYGGTVNYYPQYIQQYNSPLAITIGSGMQVIVYPTTYSAIRIINGLTYTISTVSRPGYWVYTFTAGTGSITF
jgi:hypothetical protein